MIKTAVGFPKWKQEWKQYRRKEKLLKTFESFTEVNRKADKQQSKEVETKTKTKKQLGLYSILFFFFKKNSLFFSVIIFFYTDIFFCCKLHTYTHTQTHTHTHTHNLRHMYQRNFLRKISLFFFSKFYPSKLLKLLKNVIFTFL